MGYEAVADSPWDGIGQFDDFSGKVKLAKEPTRAFGEKCFDLTFGTDVDYIIYKIVIATGKTGKLPLDSWGDWGILASSVEASPSEASGRHRSSSTRAMNPEVRSRRPQPRWR